jgi:hypothetical protein
MERGEGMTMDDPSAPQEMNAIRIDRDVAVVPLTMGFHAIIDASDAPLICEQRWRVQLAKCGLKYAVSGTRPRVVLLHRMLLDAEKGQIVDHINGDGLDNRRSNLRFATHSQNMANRKVARDGCKGVWFDKRDGCWRAELHLGGKKVALGTFPTEADAARAYDRAALAAYGTFARTNAMLGLFADEAPLVFPFTDMQPGPRLLRLLEGA